MTVREFLIETFNTKFGSMIVVRPHAICADGFELSIQASEGHYCLPRETLMDADYHSVEVLVCSKLDDYSFKRFMKHSSSSEDGRLFAHVDMDFLEMFVEEHGGIVNLNLNLKENKR